VPPSEAQKSVEEFRLKLAALEAAQVQMMIDAYEPVQSNLDAATLRVIALWQKRKLKPWQIMKMTAMTALKVQIIGDLALYHSVVSTGIAQAQAGAVALAQQSAFATMSAGLPPGITADMLANVGLEWNRLPREAFANFIGISGSGAPLGDLLAPLGPQLANATTEAIGEGIVRGYSPRKTAKLAQQASGMQLSKVLSIARTETNRAHREASRLQYAANPNLVKGYRRSSAKDSRVCIACIALDGELYEVEEPLNSHVNCRCAMVPETITYEDLGLDVPMPDQPENAKDWFAQQDESTQRAMMKNPARFEAWKSGKVGLGDLVKVTEDPVWGKSAGVAPLKDLNL
jgi:SPP1 gp7 family putative phage head morphogenesis protein